MKKTLSLLFLSIVCLVIVALSATTISALKLRTDPPIIHNVECVGSVQGIWEMVTNLATGEQRQVAKFMGIPFVGQQPVGRFRFKRPQPFSPSEPICNPKPGSIYNATYYRSVCVQLDNYGEGPNVVGDEDCLYIQAVYVPEPIYDQISNSGSAASRFPVSLYFHGGSNMFGSGMNEKHGFISAFYGEYLNHTDPFGAVFITVNYRLGLFGFLAAESFGTDVNFGIQDSIAAAKWTSRNVAKFGGNPAKIQASGQSSGGTNLFAMIATFQIKGLFSSIVSMSGSPNITMDRTSKLAQDLPVIEQLGCTNAQQALTCLQAIDAITLMKATPASWMTPTLCSEKNVLPNGKHYVGLPFVDGNVIVMPFKEALVSGLNGDIPTVISGMQQECNLFPTQPLVMINATDAAWKKYLSTVFFPNFPSPQKEKLVDAVYNTYGKEMRVNTNLAMFTVSADFSVNCANIYLANQTITSNPKQQRTAPLYHSINRWQPSFPQNNGPFSYAFHLFDYLSLTQMWFEITPFDGFKPGPSDFRLSEMLRSQWYRLMNDQSLEYWSYPDQNGNHQQNEVIKWPPVNAAPSAGVTSFVYSNNDAPYSWSHSQSNLNSYQCEMWRSFGFDERYWWCN